MKTINIDKTFFAKITNFRLESRNYHHFRVTVHQFIQQIETLRKYSAKKQ